MALLRSKEVICSWNPEIDALVILFLDDNNLIYNVGGKFGKGLQSFISLCDAGGG